MFRIYNAFTSVFTYSSNVIRHISDHHNPYLGFQTGKVPVLCSTGPPSDLHTAAQEFSFHSIIKQATLASLSCPRIHHQSTQRVLLGSGGTQSDVSPSELLGNAPEKRTLSHTWKPATPTIIYNHRVSPASSLLTHKGPFSPPPFNNDAELCSKYPPR